jgi:CHAT domain-containing protein
VVQEIDEFLIRVIAADEPWPVCQELLDANAKELLSDAADGVIAVLHSSHRHDRDFQLRVELARMLLAEARDRGHRGLDRTLSSYFAPIFGPGGDYATPAPPHARPPSPLDDLDENERLAVMVVEAIVLSRSWPERRRILGAYPDVLRSGAAERTLTMFGEAVNDDQWRELYADLRTVLADACERGAAAVFGGELPAAFLYNPLPEPRPLFTRDEAIQLLVIQYADIPTWERRRGLVTAYPDLLLDEQAAWTVEEGLRRRTSTDPEIGERYRVAGESLRRAGTEGVAEAFAPPLQPTGVRLNVGQVLRVLADPGAGSFLDVVAGLRAAVHYTDPVLAPWTWARLNIALAACLAEIDDAEARLRPIYVEEALRRLSDAVQVVTAATSESDWLEVQTQLGRAYLLRERGDRAANVEAAIRCFEEVVGGRARAGDEQAAAVATVRLAQAYLKRPSGVRVADLDTAYRLCQAALARLDRVRTPADWAWATTTLGQVRFEQRWYGAREVVVGEAIEHLERALSEPSLAPSTRVGIQLQLALAHGLLIAESGDEHDRRSLKLIDGCLQDYPRESSPWAWASAQHALAVVHVRGGSADENRQEQAERCFRAALEVFDAESYPGPRRRTLKELGGLLFRQRRWTECLTALDETMALGDYLESGSESDAGRIAEISEMGDVPERAAYCLVRTGRPGPALTVLDAGKTRLLRQVLAVEPATATPAGAPAEPRDLVPDGGALVVPLLTTQGSVAFVLTGQDDAPEGTVLPLGAHLHQELRGLLESTPERPGWLSAYRQWRDAFDARDLAATFDDEVAAVAEAEYERAEREWAGTLARTSRRLWNLLGGPLHEHLSARGLPEGAPLTVVSAGLLSLLPLHAAWRLVPDGRRYLLDDYTVSYTPSLAVLDACRRRAREPRPAGLLGVVNPTGDLPYASDEAARIRAVFSDGSARLLGAETTVKLLIEAVPGRTHLHFACHAGFDWMDTTNSGLALAGDRWLTVGEITERLSFDAARLVVLSACETGLSDVDRIPNEYIGLPGAFLHGGAPAVVSSLWRVDDQATARLMELFYRVHVAEHSEPAAALRRAQREIRSVADFEHPYYWAGFSFTGA